MGGHRWWIARRYRVRRAELTSGGNSRPIYDDPTVRLTAARSEFNALAVVDEHLPGDDGGAVWLVRLVAEALTPSSRMPITKCRIDHGMSMVKHQNSDKKGGNGINWEIFG